MLVKNDLRFQRNLFQHLTNTRHEISVKRYGKAETAIFGGVAFGSGKLSTRDIPSESRHRKML